MFKTCNYYLSSNMDKIFGIEVDKINEGNDCIVFVINIQEQISDDKHL